MFDKLAWQRENRRKNLAHTRALACKSYHTRKKNRPWMITLSRIKARCNNPNRSVYKCYGGKGIKCLITADQLKMLWFRDKAYLMKQPSIDRIDAHSNYFIKNCRYLELEANRRHHG